MFFECDKVEEELANMEEWRCSEAWGLRCRCWRTRPVAHSEAGTIHTEKLHNGQSRARLHTYDTNPNASDRRDEELGNE